MIDDKEYADTEEPPAARQIIRQDAVRMLKSYLDAEISDLTAERAGLTDEERLDNPNAFREKSGCLLKRMVCCDYSKRFAWADYSLLEKQLEEDARDCDAEDSRSMLMNIRGKSFENKPNSDVYIIRLLLKIIESKPHDYALAERIFKSFLQ